MSIAGGVSRIIADASRSPQFPTIRWSRVIIAGDRVAPEARAALADLCQACWYRICAFIRCRVRSADEATDLTQDNFTWEPEKPVIATARSKDRFRAFLMTDCRHFLLERDCKKRVRARVLNPVLIDADSGENRWKFESASDTTADRLFDRTWELPL